MARRNLATKLLDERWVPMDQLIMLKGAVELTERNMKWLEVKDDMENKNLDSRIRHVSQNVKRLRELIKKYKCGFNVDAISDILKQDKEVYLICQNKTPDKIIENLNHMIFCQRKAVDKIKYEINHTKQELFEVELNIAVFKEKVNEGHKFVRNERRDEDMKYSAALEFANIQTEVCSIVKECYKKIIGVLKKDSYYYEDVIKNLQNDALIQSETILKIMELGTLAKNDFERVKQDAKKIAVRFNANAAEHRAEIKKCAQEIETLELILAKLNEYGANAYPMFQEVDEGTAEDDKTEALAEQLKESEEAIDELGEILGVQKLTDVFSGMEKLETRQFKLNDFIEKGKIEGEAEKKVYLKTKTLAKYMDYFMSGDVNRLIKEEQIIQDKIDATAVNIQEAKAAVDEIKERIDKDKEYFLYLKRLLWIVDIGQPEKIGPVKDEKGRQVENVRREDPFELFTDSKEQRSATGPSTPVPEKESLSDVCDSDDEDIPIRLMDLVTMKTKVLLESIGDEAAGDDCDPAIFEAFGDTLAEEQDMINKCLKENLSKEDELTVRKYKPNFEDSYDKQGCEKKSRLQLKFMSRQLVVKNEIAKEKGEIRFHLHPQGVFRGMYIKPDSSESSEAEEDKNKGTEEEKAPVEVEKLEEDESDIGYEPSEKEDSDSDLDPNQPKPHICYQ